MLKKNGGNLDMRKVIEVNQDEIDSVFEVITPIMADYVKWRAFQDSEIDILTTATEIYVRKGTDESRYSHLIGC